MDPTGGHVVLDISSDEEGLVSEVMKGSDGESYDWLADLLEGDSDEVVVLKEFNAKSKSNKVVNKEVTNDDVDDDDCVVLDGDPEKSVSAPDDAVDGGSDDLLIVGEKGQVACRDYPHPRHDCVIFPFSSTFHEKHCSLCHCYVCDSPAPCAYWGKGMSNVDHCHANDKQEEWKVCRKNFMQGKSTPMSVPSTPMPVPSFRPDAVSTVLPQPTQPLHSINSQPPFNSIPQNVVLTPTIFRPYSSPIGSGVLRNLQNTKKHHPGHVSRSKYQPLSSSGRLHQASHVIQKDRGHRDSYLGPHHISPIMTQKRTGTVGSSQAGSRAAFGPNNISYAPCLPFSTNSIHNNIVNRNHIRRQTFPSSLNLAPSANLSSCLPSSIGVSSSIVPCQPSQANSDGQGSNQPLSGQNIHQHLTQPSTFPCFIDSLTRWSEFSAAPPVVESIHVPSTEPAHEAQPAREFNAAVAESLDISAACVDFENWLLESPHLEDNFSPVPAAVDAGMLSFDFETSWNSVTQ